MRIRSITIFDHPGEAPRAGGFLQQARVEFEKAGFEVQSLRLAAPPFEDWMGSLEPAAVASRAAAVEAETALAGIDYVSLGPARPESPAARAAVVPILRGTSRVFCSAILTDPSRGVNLDAVQASASIIRQAAQISPDGFANLRFAALANVKPGSPFFPAAYGEPGRKSFALAVEAADLAVEAFSQAGSLEEARRLLVQSIEDHAGRLAPLADTLAVSSGIPLGGIDFTLAPFPEVSRSIGAALERLGVGPVGQGGTLAAAALVTTCIDQARFPRTGFCGLMLPVLEDAVLARRAAGGSLSVSDLLLYSAVCGTGLDTIPLPGDASQADLEALLLDMAALACRLDKPLTARLMPIPGKKAGDPTGFDFAFFANSQVMALKPASLTGLLAAGGWLPITPRQASRD